MYRELGIGIVPYSPLGRGFFGGKAVIESIPANSFLVCSWFFIPYLCIYKQIFFWLVRSCCFSLVACEIKLGLMANFYLLSERKSKISRREFWSKQDLLFSIWKVGWKAWMHPCTTCTCMDSLSRRWCGSHPWWVTLVNLVHLQSCMCCSDFPASFEFLGKKKIIWDKQIIRRFSIYWLGYLKINHHYKFNIKYSICY